MAAIAQMFLVLSDRTRQKATAFLDALLGSFKPNSSAEVNNDGADAPLNFGVIK